MAGLNSIDHSRWPEVATINRYALFMGYQTLAVRGLGLLMLTWAVSVLLGGFVSNLGDTDFWFLAFITLVQAARVFDFSLKERTSDIYNSLRGLGAAATATLLWLLPCHKKKGKTLLGICYVLWFVVVVVQLWAITTFVAYLAILYVLGIWISAVFSIMRLKVRDYGIDGNDRDQVRERLTLALTILYSLGVAQGAFSLLGLWNYLARPGLAEGVAGSYGLNVQLVSEYLDETVTGCMKDPSFARGRNLVTYGVDLLLMESTSTTTSSSSSRACRCSKYLSGLTILGSILQQDTDTWWFHRHNGHRDASGGLIRESAKELNFYGFYGNPQKLSLFEKLLCFIAGCSRRINPPASVHGGQPAVQLMKQLLIASASFGQLIQRLLETLGPGSPYSGELREHAARILAEVAGSVRLEQFAGATQCISSSLLHTFEEHCWRPEGYERDSDLPEEYERDWLLEEQERSYVRVVGHWRRRLRFLRLLVKKPFHCVCVAMASGDRSPPPQVPPESDDGEKSRSLIHGYVRLVISGLRVLQALASSEDNCRFISSSGSTRGGGGEVSRIMRPLASDGLHRDHHDEWCMIAEESLKLLTLLMAAPGETGEALRVQIAGDTAGAVAALETVLGCPRCQVALKRQAVEVLLGLPPPVDTSSIVVPRGSGSRAVFMGILLHIFLLPDQYFGGMSGPTHLLKKRSCTRRLAGEKLLAMVSALQQPSEDDHGGGATATSMSHAAAVALGNLTSTVVGAGNDASWRIHAARILEDLCQDYTKDDGYLKEIKKAMCIAMPEVLKQLLDGCVSTTQAVTVITETKKAVHCQAPAAGPDLEQGAVSDDTIGEETAASHRRQQAKDDEQPAEGMELYQALVSLCHGIPNSWTDSDKDLASELNGIAAEMCAKEGMAFSTFISLRAELKRRYCWEDTNARVRAN